MHITNKDKAIYYYFKFSLLQRRTLLCLKELPQLIMMLYYPPIQYEAV